MSSLWGFFLQEDEDLQELSHIGVDVITETDEIEIEPDAIEELESIQLDRSITDGQSGTE
ncbi:hypothetical protein DPMN_059264 [Dreissena polymorpha]|uniref:Uncharacterized protein n=1 Tax=Dreissena polymorpha TaxID=45954 RepID=A0A9D4HET2_DREPO|nr:hypothetical protein DPMN_059264 [Dreissena polymorpha]